MPELASAATPGLTARQPADWSRDDSAAQTPFHIHIFHNEHSRANERVVTESFSLRQAPVFTTSLLHHRARVELARANTFDGQLGIGGDDPHPLLYKQTDTSKTIGDISLERDREQIKYLNEYMQHGKGRVFYICGSMQRAGISDGHGFNCDLAGKTQRMPHGENGRPVILEVQADPGSEVAVAAQATRFRTSNSHHAAIDGNRIQDQANPPRSKIISFNIEPDGTRGNVVKSIEFPGNVGLGTQFHPEFRGSEAEENIVHYVATGWKMRGRYASQSVVGCMEKRLSSIRFNPGEATGP